MIETISTLSEHGTPSSRGARADQRNNHRRLKIAICATHPIQYQAPLWRHLAQRAGVQVKVFYGSDMSVRGYSDQGFGVTIKWDTPLLEGYDHEFVSTDPRIQQIGFRSPGCRGLFVRLAKFSPDVVLLTAYSGLFHLGAMFAAHRLGAKIVMRHEASDVAVARSGSKGLLRDFLLRRLYARVDRFAAIGHEARQHLRRLGVTEGRIGASPYCVDSDYLERQWESWSPQRERLRTELGVPRDGLVLIFSGKLTAKKNPLLITAALATLPAALLGRVHLLVAGDGDLKPAFKRAGRSVLGDRLHLLGFLNQSEMGRAYAAADVLVLPSVKGAGETWGLVVNEAMQFRLPVIVSDGVGCHSDLVAEGKNGFVFRSGDVAGLAAAIRTFSELSSDDRGAFNTGALARAAAFSLDAAAIGLESVFATFATGDNLAHPAGTAPLRGRGGD